MKIQSFNNLYNPFKLVRLNNAQQECKETNPFINGNLTSDVVTFRGKAYSADSVENPTNHCAYCGEKVYTDSQIESIAKSMLQYKSHRLHGEIKSVLEKLDTAERSYELTVAKQMENEKEIDFFKKFLGQAENKSFLKGETIFQQVYSLEYDDALALLKKNMRPLLRTIDHVSPQKLGEDNKDDDINLVEACYCCNHDLKRGMPFSEFYTMYPSIKENMPVDKFKYAHAKLLVSSDVIMHKLSAGNLIKLLSGLFEQRERVTSQLDNVDFRILESSSSVVHSINTCKDEIKAKEDEISALKLKLSEISDDDEYQAMLERISLTKQKSGIEDELTSLREKRKNASDSLNELKNPPKKGKKSKTELSHDQIEQKKALYRQIVIDMNSQIAIKEEEETTLTSKIAKLDVNYPTPEILQSVKYSFDSIVNAYAQLILERQNFEQLKEIQSSHSATIQQLEEKIAKCPSDTFDISKYSPEEQTLYSNYVSYMEALKYIEQHLGGGNVRNLVNTSAKIQIQQEMANLEKEDVIVVALSYIKRKELQSKLDSEKKQLAEVSNKILPFQNKIKQLERKTEQCTLEQAKKESENISERIRILTDKQNYLKIPQTIEKLEAEILLLNSTIKSLEVKLVQIKDLKTSET